MVAVRKYFKKHAKSIAALLAVAVFLIGFLFIQLMFVRNNRVSSDGITEYVQEYLSEYTYLYNGQNVPIFDLNITNLSNFTFFLRYQGIDTTAVISTTHGAALFFNVSEQGASKATVNETSDPIEYSVWPQMLRNMTGLPSVAIEPGDYPLDGVVTVDKALLYVEPGANLRCVLKDRPFNVTSNGAIWILGTYILEHSILLKGSNAKEDWSKTQADIDALSEFLWDCKGTGMNDTSIQNIETKYKPSMLLDRIASRMKSGAYKNNHVLFNSDYEELRRVAAGTMDDMLTKVLNDYYALQQVTPQSLFEQIGNYLLQKADAIVMSVVPTAIITWLAANRRKSKQSQTSRKKA
jgi:hypothetical protein